MNLRSIALAAVVALCAAGCDDEEGIDVPPRDEVVDAAIETAKRDGWEKRWENLYPVGALPPEVCAAMVYGLGLAVPLAIATVLAGVGLGQAVAARRARRGGERARAAMLVAGPTVIHGRVVSVAAEGESDAIVVELEQSGSERRMNEKSYKVIWTEIDRRTTATPFVVELEGGECVRVEPDADAVRLIDGLGPPEPNGFASRVRRARLQVGESVYLSGVLERRVDVTAGMRGEVSGWVLRPPDYEPMLASTHPLEREHGRRARRAFWWALAFVAATAFTLWLVHGPYLALVQGHHRGTAVVVAKTSERRDKKTYYLVTVVIAETGQAFREALDEGVFERIERGARVPVVFRPDEVRHSQLGRQPAAYYGKLIESLAWLGGLVFLYIRGRRKSLPWYERPRIVQTEAGRLSPEQPFNSNEMKKENG